MRRRSRLLRIAKWGGVVVCLALIAVGVANLWYTLLWILPDGSALTTGSGVISFSWRTWSLQGGGVFVVLDADEWLFWPAMAIDRSPTVASQIWLPLLAIGIPTIVAWRLDRRRPLPGHCPCGYDLRGNVSGTCPECGAVVIQRAG